MRHHLHSHPELSGNEYKTAQWVQEMLLECKPTELKTGIGGAGLYALWDSGKPGLHGAFRAELDALPIDEVADWDYASQTPGVSHKCGHDGHATLLLGLARYIAANMPQSGKVSLLFQPAEETGTGAQAMLKDPQMQDYKPDYIFALHNVPGYPLHQIVLKPGAFTASVNSLILHCNGKTAHAAEPEKGVSPAGALAALIPWLQALHHEYRKKDPLSTLALVHIIMGEKTYGTSAGKASVHLTLRCTSNALREQMEQEVIDKAKQLCQEHKLDFNFEQTESFAATQNHSEAAQRVAKAAQALELDLLEKEQPFRWGEDFGLFTDAYKGCMLGLGAGANHAPLHHPDYDFPDSLLPTGVSLFATLYRDLCLT